MLQRIWATPWLFKHEDEGASPKMAKRLERMLEARLPQSSRDGKPALDGFNPKGCVS